MGSHDKKKKKFDFKAKKDCACKSLREVNCFLCNLSRACTLKKIIKKY